MKILNFGSCNVDYVYTMDHIVAKGETEAAAALNVFAGGKGLNQSIAIARSGHTVYHAGCIGEGGDFLLQMLRENGVDVSYMTRVAEKNGHAIIQVDKMGANSIFLYPGSNVMITDAQIDRVLAAFSAGDLLLLQNEINDIDRIIDKAYAKGMTVLLNPSPCNERLALVDLHKVSYLILNEVEMRALSGRDNLQEALAYFEENYPDLRLMLTLGERGCIYRAGETLASCPAFRVEAVDTTGAGDTFTGYFIGGLADGLPMEKTLRLAACAAAIGVTREGAAPSIPYAHEVESGLSSLVPGEGDIKAEMLRARIEAFVENDLQGATLVGLAAALGYSAVYTGKIFKRLMGEPFTGFVQKKRLEAGARLLRETDLSIEEIIKRVGYDNASFFRRLFKKKYGTMPLQYRKGRVK